jgi:hypothetical protein
MISARKRADRLTRVLRLRFFIVILLAARLCQDLIGTSQSAL